ncbi:DNA-binding protein [Georgenia deserti]|uniref:DNA-binding protein n=1 Tax=Georgenia deserti TaxID=2093781 RepID=A0ABW4L0Y2_9MICO
MSATDEDPAADRGPVFDGVRIGRPATGALLAAGYRTVGDLPADLGELLELHGVGPRAVRLLREARAPGEAGTAPADGD